MTRLTSVVPRTPRHTRHSPLSSRLPNYGRQSQGDVRNHRSQQSREVRQSGSTNWDNAGRSNRNRRLEFDPEGGSDFEESQQQDRQMPDYDDQMHPDDEDDQEPDLAPRTFNTFNTQGHTIGHPTGARTLGRGFSTLGGGRPSGTSTQASGTSTQEKRTEAQAELTAKEISAIIKQHKYLPLSVYDRDVYDLVKYRMWWGLGLFVDMFPESGKTNDFMVTIWTDALVELGEEFASNATPAQEIVEPKNSNIPYKLTKSFYNNRASRKRYIGQSVLKVFRDLITPEDVAPDSPAELNRIKSVIAALVGKEEALHFTMHRSTTRYNNSWLPGIICDNFLQRGTYYHKNYNQFLDSLNFQFIACIFAMIELNLREYADTGKRTPSLSKRSNPLKDLYIKHSKHFKIIYADDTSFTNYFVNLRLNIIRIHGDRTEAANAVEPLAPLTPEAIAALNLELASSIAEMQAVEGTDTEQVVTNPQGTTSEQQGQANQAETQQQQEQQETQVQEGA